MEVNTLAHVLIRHKVASYPKWRPLFNDGDAARKEAGAIGEPQVFRSGDDPWEVLVLIEWDELESARQFIGFPELSDQFREAMEQAGVTDEPTVFYLSQV